MARDTSYHGYTLPEPFTIESVNEWGDQLNTIFDTLDEEVILRGTLAERPAAGSSGRLYFVPSSRSLYADDGSSWSKLGAQIDITDDGSLVVGAPQELNFGTDMNVTNPTSGEALVEPTGLVSTSGDTITGDLTMDADILDSSNTPIWDESNSHIPIARFEHNSLTLNGGTGISGPGSVTLGGTASVSVDESASLTWTGSHDFTGGTITVPSPNNDTDAARKAYVDSVAEGLGVREAVVAATDGTNVDLTSSTDPNPIDGVTLADGDRVLLKNQTDATENGIYDAVTATDPTTWTRSSDFDEDSEVISGAFTFVEEGTNNANEGWVVTTNDPITVGSTAINWTQFSGAGQITAGDGLSKSGDTLNFDPGTGLSTSSGLAILDESYSANWTSTQTFSADIEDGAANTVYDQSNNWVPATRVEQGSNSGLNADQVDGFEASELRAGKNVLQLSTTDTTTDINTSSYVSIPWDVENQEDSAYSHDAGSTPETVTFNNSGTYVVHSTVSYDVDSANVSVGLKINLNGTRLNTFGQSGEVSNSNSATSGSTDVMRILSVSANDTLEIQAIQQGNAGTATMRSQESALNIYQLSVSTSSQTDADTLDGLHSTAFVRTDGSNSITGTLASNLSQASDHFRFENTNTGDQLRIASNSNGNFELVTFDSSASTESAGLRFDVSAGVIDAFDELQIENALTVNTGPVDLTGQSLNGLGDVTDNGGNTVYSLSNNWIPLTALEASSITVSAGDGLKNGGSVTLGNTTTLDIEPADFAGTFLSDDGSDNLTVNLGNGVENDGSGNIRVNPAGIAGDGLKEGSATALAVEPADFAGTFLSDDGSDNLTVNLGNGVENDGSGNVRLDEDFSATWTTVQTFSADIDDGAANTVYDQSNNWVPAPRIEQGSGSTLNADRVDSYEADEVIAQPFSLIHSEFADGLSNEEIWRISLQAGESLEVRRLQTELKGGGTDASFTVDVYDVTAASVLASTTSVTSGTPIATSGAGNDIIIRVSNSTGAKQVASINAKMNIIT